MAIVIEQRGSMTVISVILTCFNRKEKTIQCLKSLSDGNPSISFSFIIVDDNSHDGTVEAINGLNINSTILNGSGSLFWAGGIRKGINYVLEYCKDSDYILLINDDVVFFDGCIEKMILQLNEIQSSLIVGATCGKDGKLTYGAMLVKPNTSKGLFEKKDISFAECCDTFNMNCVLLETSIFRKLGNFDEGYIHSLADLDYGLRARKMGFKIYTTYEYVGFCENNSSQGTWMDKTLSRRERLRKKNSPKGAPFGPWWYFLKKNFGVIIAVRYAVSPYIRIILRK